MTKHPGKKHEYADAHEKMRMYAIKDRAIVLRDLDYEKEEVKIRIKENIEWEYEGSDLPEFYRHVDNIVEYVFKS